MWVMKLRDREGGGELGESRVARQYSDMLSKTKAESILLVLTGASAAAGNVP